MALQGKFVINDADFSPLSIFGVGTFMAFSGNGAYRNRGGMYQNNWQWPSSSWAVLCRRPSERQHRKQSKSLGGRYL